MTEHDTQIWTRRQLLARGLAAGSALLLAPGAFAERLVVTPRMTEGPFYPDKLPLDTDNDLIVINDRVTPAIGVVTWLSGRVLYRTGSPVRGATVEIWQVDGRGRYLHTGDRRRGGAERDANFQGFGRFLTDRKGQYSFRTVKPVPYPGRVPHIHVAVNLRGRRVLTTQCFIKGHPLNARDGLLRGVRDPRARDSVQVAFRPVPGSTIGELHAQFDIVLGLTPELPDGPAARDEEDRTPRRHY